MAGWTSLSGYLSFKPLGALSRLKSRKRMWCALEESKSQLIYFKSEEDASRSKTPAGEINLRGAAITLDLDNQNQFIIITDGKEFVLTAENHESMMIWLMALQAKRDLQAKAETEKKQVKEDLFDRRERKRTPAFLRDRIHFLSSSDITSTNPMGSRHRPLMLTQSLHMSHGEPMMPVGKRSRAYQLHRIGETFDSGNGPVKRESPNMRPRHSIAHLTHPIEIPGAIVPPYSRQLSVSMDSCGPTSNGYIKTPTYSGDLSSGSTGDSDDFFQEEGKPKKSKSKGDNFKRRSKQRTVDNDSDCDQCNSFDSSRCEERNRHSSMSASSDSAIEKGEMGSQDLGRVGDLEKELIATKCELAKVMNRQTCFQDLLKQKDEIILDLDDKLCQLGHGDQAYDSKKRTTKVSKEFQEKVRVLQNQNRFLNEEVRRLAKLRSSDQTVFTQQDGRLHGLEAEIEKWKFDYVSLIQSSIRFTGTDTMDDAELSLFGGDRHKIRVQNLLDEARKINPSLPTYERLANHDVHVDCYGFKHQFEDCGLLLHYLCQELSVHYLTQAGTYEEHQHSWHMHLKQNAKCILKQKKPLKLLCRNGIPDQFRKQVWRQLVHNQVQDLITEKGPHYFRNLCNLVPDSPLAARYRKQVSLDLMRTMPSNVKFATPGSRGIMDLQDILLAFCIHSPNIGYCQGMNFIVGMALLFMDAQDAFWTLVAITERFFSPTYFDHNLVGAQADQMVLKDLIREKLPSLADHLNEIDIEVSTVTLNWFLAIFFDAVPFQTLLRIWDCFLLEGPKVLFRFCLAILKMHTKEILLKNDTISVMRHLKACARITYDTDGLVKVAFEDLKPFPSRQNIQTKQTCYLNTLKEKYKRKEIQKLAFAEREQLFLSLESESCHYLSFECCAISENGDIWVCYGEQTFSKVCQVNPEQGVMLDTAIKFDTRVMCMQALANNIILYGTLSWMIYAFDMKKREKIWQIRLHDAILSLCMFIDEDECCRVFAGLADGTVAILENAGEETPTYDVMYIPIGQSPVMSVRLLGYQLWCACGNRVHIIHANTLDAMDNFTVSSNPYDHILSLEPGLPGVWISIRGSSILELWDSRTLNCKMLYDTRAGKYPNLRKEDDSYFNRARITSILPHENTVWIGTGEGNLIIYEVLEKLMCPTPSEASFSENYPENMNLGPSKEGPPGYDPVRAVEEKVRELYFKKLNSPDPISVRADTSGSQLSSSRDVTEAYEMSEFCRNNLMSSTPTDNRSHDGSVDQERSDSCPTAWFDTFSKNVSQLDGETEDFSLFANVEEKHEDKSPDVQRRPCLTRSGIAKMSETDSLLSNGDAESVESPSSMCNGDIHPNLKVQENKDDPEQKVGRIEEECLEVSVQEDLESFDQTISSTDSLDSQEAVSGSRRFVDMKSVSIDSGIRIGSEDVPHPTDQKPELKQSSEQTESQEKSETEKDNNCNSAKMNGHIYDSDMSSETGCESSNLLSVQMKDSSNHSSVRTLCTDTETDYVSAREPEVSNSDSVSCNESFKRLRRLSGKKKPLTKQNSVNLSVNHKDDSDDDVFVDADEKPVQKTSSLENVLSSVNEAFEVKTDHSPKNSPRAQLNSASSEQNIKPKNQETQWRIDFTGIHVDTDTESRLSVDGFSDLDSVSQGHRLSIDAQPELKQFSKQNNTLTNFDPQNFIFPEDFSLEQKMAKFLHTPSLGTPQSSNTWSCYGSTPTRDLDTSSADQRRVLLRGDSLQSDVSRGASSISLATMAESLYAADLFVQAKVKISDKPVKCLVHLTCSEEPLILSLSGSFGDDEAVLKWSRAPNEQMIWTNDPILEFCLDTNTPKLPSYMRNRMSSTSSVTSNKSNRSNGSVKQFSQGSE